MTTPDDASTDPDGPAAPHSLRFDSRAGRTLMAATIIASGMAFLDGTVVNVALPHLADDLGGGLATMQWVLDAYLLLLGALVLVGGALGDLLGRKRVFVWGIVGFALTSLICGVAASAPALIAARAAQGAAAALMVPGSLALLSSLFRDEDRGRAIGLWSGLSGIMTAVGPFVGGIVVDATPSGWRWVFLLNLPFAIAALWLCRSIPVVPGHRRPGPVWSQVDLLGAALTVVGLGLLVGPLIEARTLGTMLTAALMIIGAAALVAFWFLEKRREATGSPPPMLPPRLWRIRSFTVANLITFVVYGALGAMLFLLTIGLQIGLGWSALGAGAAGVPITILLATLSSPIGGLVPKVGSRLLLTVGCVGMASGMALLALLPAGGSYWANVLPGLLVFGVGLAFIVAPITTTALGDIPADSSGIGSGVNNAVARIAGLVAVAAIPLIAGLAAGGASGPAVLPGYQRAMLICAGLCATAAVLTWVGFTRDTGRVAEPSGA